MFSFIFNAKVTDIVACNCCFAVIAVAIVGGNKLRYNFFVDAVNSQKPLVERNNYIEFGKIVREITNYVTDA